MYEFIDQISRLVPGFVLIFSRVGAMIMTLPLLGSSLISARIRVIFSAVMTMILVPVLADTFPAAMSIPEILIGVAKEVTIGLFIGIGTSTIFNAFSMSGAFIGRQMGLAMANVVDPNSADQLPIIGQFFMLIVTTYFFTSDSHHLFIHTVYENFRIVPLQAGGFPPVLGRGLINSGTTMFNTALRLAIPTMLMLLMIECAVGITVRVMPQMNAFFITLPLRLGVGIYAVVTSLQIFQLMFETVYVDITTFINSSLFGIGGS